MGQPFRCLLQSKPAGLSPAAGAGAQHSFPTPPHHYIHPLSPYLPISPKTLGSSACVLYYFLAKMVPDTHKALGNIH